VTKHGADIMTAIRDAILGRPWTPPAWHPADSHKQRSSRHPATSGYFMEWS
jgi:hypothetical protein